MLETYYRIDKAAGVHVVIGADGQLNIHACSIAVQKDQLEIERKITGLQSIGQLKEKLPAGTAIALNLSGRGVLIKQTEVLDEINSQNFSQVLPNANIDDFYVQHFASGDRSFVSLVRRSDADRWLQQLTDIGFSPLVLSLGPFAVSNTLPQLNIYGTDIAFDNYRIACNESNDWLSCKYDTGATTPFPVKLETESLAEQIIIPYSAAFQLVLQSAVNVIKADVVTLDEALHQTIDKKKFKIKGFIILIAFFLLLLVNFVVFSWLSSQNESLAGLVSRSAQQTDNLQHLEKKVQEKEALLNKLGWDGGVKKSILIDQLAALLPQNVTWTSVEVNPVDMKASREKKQTVFENRKIRVKGTTDRVIALNEWMAMVKTKPWVKIVRLEKYTYDQELATGQFIIEIDY